MLTLAFIRENKDAILKGLAVRNFANAEETIDKVIEKDALRRSTQAELDETLAESNKLSKEIGMFFKSGQVQKANLIKEKTGQLKDRSKELNEKLSIHES